MQHNIISEFVNSSTMSVCWLSYKLLEKDEIKLYFIYLFSRIYHWKVDKWGKIDKMVEILAVILRADNLNACYYNIMYLDSVLFCW